MSPLTLKRASVRRETIASIQEVLDTTLHLFCGRTHRSKRESPVAFRKDEATTTSWSGDNNSDIIVAGTE